MEAINEKMPVQKKPLSARALWTIILCCCVGLAVLVVALFPVINKKLLMAKLTDTSNNGRDIYRAMFEANEKRKSVGLPSIWPKTCLATTNLSQDISGMTFKTSTEYFKVLFDEAHMGTDAWKPYVKGIDYSKLAGMGVPVSKTQRLTSTNNMWAIAANITDDDAAIIPFLVTRNVDVKALEYESNSDSMGNNPDVRIALGKGDYQTPFGDKGFVCVRTGGGGFYTTSKYATTRILFYSMGSFSMAYFRPRDPTNPPIVYLMP
jgi:hypothetical protein